MAARRVMRHMGNTRVGLHTALLIILALLTLHTGILILTRSGIIVFPYRQNDRSSADKKREIVATSEKTNGDAAPADQTNATTRTDAPEVKPVDLHEIIRNLGRQLDSALSSGNKSESTDVKNKETVLKQEEDEGTTESNKSNSGKKDCLRYITIYTPRMQPFHYWREYVNLEEAFMESRYENSTYYDSRITQRREFPTMFIECPGYRCDIALRPTVDERFLTRSDAILLNLTPQEVRYKMPSISKRLAETLPRRVKIFFYAMECPLMMSVWDHTIADIMYHYSWTYHSASDIYFPYGRYVVGEPTDTTDINYAENKTKLLVWTASNCKNTFWPRLEWVNSLQKIMSFDTYGKCGTMTCLPPLSPNCTRNQQVYKFYLALENAPCDEYISEKFWVNSLSNGVVPLVYGGKREGFERMGPPNSFVHVSDFSSQRELVDYLKMIDKNDNLYNEFFAWRKMGRVEKVYPDLYPQSFCRILPKLSKYSNPPIKRVGDSPYFTGCRGGPRRNFTQEGDINNWEPWR